MARARMIARNITKSKKIAQLTDTERVIYAFLLPFLDREGRINAHPTYLKGQVFLHLEYTEAQIDGAVRRFHDVGLVTLYATEDDVVMEFKDFLVYNAPNKREAQSEYPAPTDEAREHRPERSEAPPRTMHGQRTDKVRGEVEVEREVEVEVEVESEMPSGAAGYKKNQSQENTRIAAPAKTSATATAGEDRSQSFNLIKAKLGNRFTNHADGDPPIDLVTECLSEDPSRDRWFDLPPNKIRALIQKAANEKKRLRHGTFKGHLIELLDREATTDTYAATTPPVAGAPPGADDALVREAMGDELYEEMFGAAGD